MRIGKRWQKAWITHRILCISCTTHLRLPQHFRPCHLPPILEQGYPILPLIKRLLLRWSTQYSSFLSYKLANLVIILKDGIVRREAGETRKVQYPLSGDAVPIDARSESGDGVVFLHCDSDRREEHVCHFGTLGSSRDTKACL